MSVHKADKPKQKAVSVKTYYFSSNNELKRQKEKKDVVPNTRSDQKEKEKTIEEIETELASAEKKEKKLFEELMRAKEKDFVCKPTGPEKKDICPVDDELANFLLKLWGKYFPGTSAVTMPSTGDGVFTMTHGMKMPLMKVNGLVSKSPLANNALFSTEVSEGKYINLYEIMIPDIPGKCGAISTAQVYINALHRYGLDVAGVHTHWSGSFVLKEATWITAVHHQTTSDLDPVEFSKKTIKAIWKAEKAIAKATSEHK